MARLVSDPYDGVDWGSIAQHKAQFHTHTAHAPTEGHSGRDPPQAVIDAYHEAGYSVLVLNEHEYNIQETTWPWTELDALADGEYANRDPAELGMVAIEGCELTARDDADIQRDVLSLYNGVADSGSTLADTLTEIGERGGLAILPHPGRYHDPDEYERYTDYFDEYPHLLGVEAYNARGRYPRSRALWDELLTHYAPQRSIWGFACDDYHGTGDYGCDESMTILLLSELTDESVREAIETGRSLFAHRAGDAELPAIDGIVIDEDAETITVAATTYENIEWISEGEVVATGETLSYEDDTGAYARASITNGQGEIGTQPFTFRKE